MALIDQINALASRIATELNTKSDSTHSHHIVLNAGDPVPPGTPEGTLIFRRAT